MNRTPAQARICAYNHRLDVRRGYKDCKLVRDLDGKAIGFIHPGKAVTYGYQPLFRTVVNTLVNGARGNTTQERRIIITLARSLRLHGDTRLVTALTK